MGSLALHYITLLLLMLWIAGVYVGAVSFEWGGAGDTNFTYEGDASVYGPHEVKLTVGVADAVFHPSSGRMRYAHPISLCSSSSSSSFNTSFSFQMSSALLSNHPAYRGDGIAFFISSAASLPPPPLPTTKGLFAGLFGNSSSAAPSTDHPLVFAVEFDSSQESWDPNDNHVGVDVGSVVSTHTAPLNASGIVLNSGRTITAWIEYKGSSQGQLNVYAAYSDSDGASAGAGGGRPILLLSIHKLRLCSVLQGGPAIVGFSSASRGSVETHDLLSWTWQSS